MRPNRWLIVLLCLAAVAGCRRVQPLDPASTKSESPKSARPRFAPTPSPTPAPERETAERPAGLSKEEVTEKLKAEFAEVELIEEGKGRFSGTVVARDGTRSSISVTITPEGDIDYTLTGALATDRPALTPRPALDPASPPNPLPSERERRLPAPPNAAAA